MIHVIRSGSTSLYLTELYIVTEKKIHFEEHVKYLQETRTTKIQILADTTIELKFGDTENLIDPKDIHIYLSKAGENFRKIYHSQINSKPSIEHKIPISLSEGEYYIKSICNYMPTKSYHYTAHKPLPKLVIWITPLKQLTKTLLFTKTSFEKDTFEPKKFTKQEQTYHIEVKNIEPGTYMVDWA